MNPSRLPMCDVCGWVTARRHVECDEFDDFRRFYAADFFKIVRRIIKAELESFEEARLYRRYYKMRTVREMLAFLCRIKVRVSTADINTLRLFTSLEADFLRHAPVGERKCLRAQYKHSQ